MSEIDLLPRADLPVIWDNFKAKAEFVWSVAKTLVVTDVSQKEAMALARKTRLTLREIRIAVEHKRVELGEGHLKEIQKVNGAAKAIREFIEPLEARLLVQESFAERAEADRIAELSKSRNDILASIRPHTYIGDTGTMAQDVFDAHVLRLRSEQAELETANRLRVEAEKRLAETQAQALVDAQIAKSVLELAQRVALDVKQKRDAEVRAELDRQREEQKRLNDEAEQARFEQEKKHRDELSAALAIRNIEREAEAQRGREVVRIEREKVAKLEAENAALEFHLAEAALEVARVAAVEEKRLRDIACAPDVEKLWDFACRINGVKCPPVTSDEAKSVVERVSNKFVEIGYILKTFCRP